MQYCVAVHITVAKIVERRYNYKICYRQDYLACFHPFPVYPVTSGFARSVIGAAVGGSTQLTTLFSVLTLLSVILYIGPALAYLPRLIWLMSMMFTICFDVGEGLALAVAFAVLTTIINGKYIYDELISRGIKIFFVALSSNLIKMFDATNFHETIPRNVIIEHLDDVYNL
ncbi:unnamed protein product [Wuchereria bancrofti]|uniref:SLC26A/SulP transporter domain-containing protein n=1 Tax=Wuchereria bancrofti TaxID=6293 RepID=A0A3P7DIW5_WUCBA|nr:unnamed protein product [Wuchereria bancrofti]